MIVSILWTLCAIINFIGLGYSISDTDEKILKEVDGVDLFFAFIALSAILTFAAPVVTLMAIGVYLRRRISDKQNQ